MIDHDDFAARGLVKPGNFSIHFFRPSRKFCVVLLIHIIREREVNKETSLQVFSLVGDTRSTKIRSRSPWKQTHVKLCMIDHDDFAARALVKPGNAPHNELRGISTSSSLYQ